MKNHKITVRDRSISVDDKRIVANSINIDTITLDLDEEWSGYTVYIVLGSGKNVYRAKWGYLPLTFPKPLMGETGVHPRLHSRCIRIPKNHDQARHQRVQGHP